MSVYIYAAAVSVILIMGVNTICIATNHEAQIPHIAFRYTVIDHGTKVQLGYLQEPELSNGHQLPW